MRDRELREKAVERMLPTDLRKDDDGRIWSYYRDRRIADLVDAVPGTPFVNTLVWAKDYLAAIDDWLDAQEEG